MSVCSAFFGKPGLQPQNPGPPAAVSGIGGPLSPASSHAARLRAQVTWPQGRAEGGTPLTACHSPAAQRCVGHSGRWQSRCGGGRPAGSHSASSAAFGVPPWQCTTRRWMPRPQDTEHWRKGQKVSGGPRRSRHGKFPGFALCSVLNGGDSNALTPAFKLPGEALHCTREKFCKGRADRLKSLLCWTQWEFLPSPSVGSGFPGQDLYCKNLWRQQHC